MSTAPVAAAMRRLIGVGHQQPARTLHGRPARTAVSLHGAVPGIQALPTGHSRRRRAIAKMVTGQVLCADAMLDDLDLPTPAGLTDDAVAGRAASDDRRERPATRRRGIHWSEPLTLRYRQPEAVPR
jgi:hypothetical protein